MIGRDLEADIGQKRGDLFSGICLLGVPLNDLAIAVQMALSNRHIGTRLVRAVVVYSIILDFMEFVNNVIYGDQGLITSRV